jgi:hypothetical protein
MKEHATCAVLYDTTHSPYVTHGTVEFIRNYTYGHVIMHNSEHMTFLPAAQDAQ